MSSYVGRDDGRRAGPIASDQRRGRHVALDERRGDSGGFVAERIHVPVLQNLLADQGETFGEGRQATGVQQRTIERREVTALKLEGSADPWALTQAASAAAPVEDRLIPREETAGSGRQRADVLQVLDVGGVAAGPVAVLDALVEVGGQHVHAAVQRRRV